MEGENTQPQEEQKLINKHDFYFETPLYELLEYTELEDPDNLLREDVDAYSAKNDTDTTYSVKFNWIIKLDTKYVNSYTEYYSGFGMVMLSCKRKSNDVLRFFVYNDEINKRIMKVGQFPSIADLQFEELSKKYENVLPKEDLKNLKKAIGLVSHGAGAGSFVYLRRIFENLIVETFNNNASTVRIPENNFKSQRMEDKIETLKDFLPSQLLEMKSIYGILSKGVHELSEEECLRYFAPLKLSIELILDQKIEEASKRKRDALVKKQLQDIHQKLSSGSKTAKEHDD